MGTTSRTHVNKYVFAWTDSLCKYPRRQSLKVNLYSPATTPYSGNCHTDSLFFRRQILRTPVTGERMQTFCIRKKKKKKKRCYYFACTEPKPRFEMANRNAVYAISKLAILKLYVTISNTGSRNLCLKINWVDWAGYLKKINGSLEILLK